jgi:hypothetical protein
VNIDTLPAGREMDALVAEKVMGRQVSASCVCCHGASCARHDDREIAPYSINLAVAWILFEKVSKLIHNTLYKIEQDHRGIVTVTLDLEVGMEDERSISVEALPNEVALAICRVALKAVM